VVAINQVGAQPGQQFNNLLGQINGSYQSKNINDEIRMIFDESYIEDAKEKAKVHETFPIGGCFMEEGKSSPMNFEVTGAVLQPKLSIAEPIENELVPFEHKRQRFIEDNYRLFWSGFITKGLKNNVGVDGYFMSGDYQLVSEEIFTLRIHNMNVSHKSNVEEVLARPCLALVAMVPSNPTQKARFHEYRSYFRDKKIIGIVNHFRNKILYIFPYYEELKGLLGGLEDGLYMIGMVSEITKKEEVVIPTPKSGNPDKQPESFAAAIEAAAQNVEAMDVEVKSDIVNELETKKEDDEIEVEDNPVVDVKSPKKEAFKVEGQSPSKESKMNEEEVDLADETPLLEIRQSPSKVKISTIEAETNDQETTNNDEITEVQPEIITQIEEV
jgi:SPOC domain